MAGGWRHRRRRLADLKVLFNSVCRAGTLHLNPHNRAMGLTAEPEILEGCFQPQPISHNLCVSTELQDLVHHTCSSSLRALVSARRMPCI